MIQQSLFDAEPIAVDHARKLSRKDGPETSRQAAEDIVEKVGIMQAWALANVEDCPRATASEICHALGIGDIRKLNRRLPELEEKGLVVREPARACKVTGKQAHPWNVVKRTTR